MSYTIQAKELNQLKHGPLLHLASTPGGCEQEGEYPAEHQS